MKISRLERLATGATLTAIGIIALATGWTYLEFKDAEHQRQAVASISRGLTELRLVTFEYQADRLERARAQWFLAFDRVEKLLTNHRDAPGEHRELLNEMRDKLALIRASFTQLTSITTAERADPAKEELLRRFEIQRFSRILILQQDLLADTFQLTDLTSERKIAAHEREIAAILVGLALIALIVSIASWLIRRRVVQPIVELQVGAKQIAEGNLDFRLSAQGANEIGDLYRQFNSMTRALQDAFAQIESKNRNLALINEELEAFSYSASHDLRGPLRRMDGFSQALLEDCGERLDDKGRHYLARIRTASQNMGVLIEDLLRLSKVTRSPLALVSVNLTRMAHEISTTLASQDGASAARWEIEDGMTVQADASLMRIALENLLGNANKFTSKTADAVIRMGTVRSEAAPAEFFVSDNGAGFDMAYADKMFGAFQRLHSESEFSGSGIGLAIVQRIIRRHNGRIRAEGKVGEGARFFFSIGIPSLQEPEAMALKV